MRFTIYLMLLYVLPVTAQEFRIDAEMRVVHKLVDLRVVNSKGEPLTGLTVDDLELTKGGKVIELSSLYWMDSSKSYNVKEAEGATIAARRSMFEVQAERPEPGVTVTRKRNETVEEDDVWPEYEATREIQEQPLTSDDYFPEPVKPKGQLVVLFFQGEVGSDRRSGLMRAVKHAEEVLEQLDPNDFVAVLSFDSHLKLHLDFTRDRVAAKDALHDAQRQLSPDPIHGRTNPGIAAYLDYEVGRNTTSVEKALEQIGSALEYLDGAKSMFFIGWGLGEYRSYGTRMTTDYGPAIQALADSRTTVMALDASKADFHSLEAGLKMVARDTGGFYDSFYKNGPKVVRKALNAVQGYYVASFSDPYPDLPGRYKIGLKNRKGEILVRSPYRAK